MPQRWPRCSLQAFIARWGTREGIEAAAANPAGGAAAEPADFDQVVKTVAKWTGLEASGPGAVPAVLAAEPSPEEEAAARLAQVINWVGVGGVGWGIQGGGVGDSTIVLARVWCFTTRGLPGIVSQP